MKSLDTMAPDVGDDDTAVAVEANPVGCAAEIAHRFSLAVRIESHAVTCNVGSPHIAVFRNHDPLGPFQAAAKQYHVIERELYRHWFSFGKGAGPSDAIRLSLALRNLRLT